MILSIDTSSTQGSWALLDKAERVDGGNFTGRASADLILSLNSSKHCMPQLRPEKILIGVGPGSFSGIRVGIATAQGLAQVWGSQLVPVRSSSAQAWKHRHVSFLGIFADAKRSHYFFTAYENGLLTRESHLIRQDELEAYLSKCSLALSPDPLPGVPTQEVPEAADLGHYYLAHGAEPQLTLEPLYLHPPLQPLVK